ncbi:MAG TPA: hypothetical protein VI953_02260 [Candidatus Paceibacterota bacterium]
MWAANFLGALAMWLQVRKIWRTKDAKSIEVISFLMFAFIQAVFTAHGWVTSTWSLFWGQLLSFLATLTVIILTLGYRYHRQS